MSKPARYVKLSVLAISMTGPKVRLQPLGWHCVECAIHHERDVREEQHPYVCGANKQ